MPTCPYCQEFISERHYERHLRRCAAAHAHEPQSLNFPPAAARAKGPERGATYGHPSSDQGKRNWKKVVLAGFVISLLIGSLVVFFILYALSLL